MKHKSLIILIVLLLLCFIKPTHAMSLKGYEMAKKDDPDITKLYIFGVGEGFSWSCTVLEAEGKQLFFCQPDHLVLNANNYVEILEREIQRQRESGNLNEDASVGVELILFFGLVRTFPCSEDK